MNRIIDEFNDGVERFFFKIEKKPALVLLAIVASYIIVFVMGWIP